MYLVGNSFHVSFKWVVIISTKQEAAHTQSAKVSTCYTLWHFGDWSLITGRGATNCRRGGGGKGVVTNYGEGGATKREGGAREVLPLQKGGAEKVLAILKGGHKKFWGRFYTVA